MVKKNLQILESEPKETRDGKAYRRIKTNEGWMSCFNSKDNAILKEANGKTLSVEVKESEDGKFQNIQKVLSGETVEDVEVVKPGEQVYKEVKKLITQPDKTATMYTSYAKDIFVAMSSNKEMAEEDMQIAIKLVKQAKEAFE